MTLDRNKLAGNMHFYEVYFSGKLIGTFIDNELREKNKALSVTEYVLSLLEGGKDPTCPYYSFCRDVAANPKKFISEIESFRVLEYSSADLSLSNAESDRLESREMSDFQPDLEEIFFIDDFCCGLCHNRNLSRHKEKELLRSMRLENEAVDKNRGVSAKLIIRPVVGSAATAKIIKTAGKIMQKTEMIAPQKRRAEIVDYEIIVGNGFPDSLSTVNLDEAIKRAGDAMLKEQIDVKLLAIYDDLEEKKIYFKYKYFSRSYLAANPSCKRIPNYHAFYQLSMDGGRRLASLGLCNMDSLRDAVKEAQKEYPDVAVIKINNDKDIPLDLKYLQSRTAKAKGEESTDAS